MIWSDYLSITTFTQCWATQTHRHHICKWPRRRGAAGIWTLCKNMSLGPIYLIHASCLNSFGPCSLEMWNRIINHGIITFYHSSVSMAILPAVMFGVWSICWQRNPRYRRYSHFVSVPGCLIAGSCWFPGLSDWLLLALVFFLGDLGLGISPETLGMREATVDCCQSCHQPSLPTKRMLAQVSFLLKTQVRWRLRDKRQYRLRDQDPGWPPHFTAYWRRTCYIPGTLRDP